ncbi:hypothetical protein PMZ80_001568 [Knufia obscura]|uniref:Uncharacterized protein n=2 Tax=Knufia TaxID=430999 RepID=A0AAN8EHF2_9EURO|nr:hypothetical protein PMZ80_001568 [Knufia obscura]KAK5955608.1 hypothetical protein OHC33_003249 [Knufia fluminis]
MVRLVDQSGNVTQPVDDNQVFVVTDVHVADYYLTINLVSPITFKILGSYIQGLPTRVSVHVCRTCARTGLTLRCNGQIDVDKLVLCPDHGGSALKGSFITLRYVKDPNSRYTKACAALAWFDTVLHSCIKGSLNEDHGDKVVTFQRSTQADGSPCRVMLEKERVSSKTRKIQLADGSIMEKPVSFYEPSLSTRIRRTFGSQHLIHYTYGHARGCFQSSSPDILFQKDNPEYPSIAKSLHFRLCNRIWISLEELTIGLPEHKKTCQYPFNTVESILMFESEIVGNPSNSKCLCILAFCGQADEETKKLVGDLFGLTKFIPMHDELMWLTCQ